MRLNTMFITAVCVIFLIKLRVMYYNVFTVDINVILRAVNKIRVKSIYISIYGKGMTEYHPWTRDEHARTARLQFFII